MIIVRSGRNPFELWMLAACFLTGAIGLIDPHGSSSVINNALPEWEVYVWYSGLVIGGGTGIGGAMLKGIVSLVTERIGLVILAGLMAAYCMSLIAQAGIRGTLPALFTGLFAVACLIRAVQISIDLKRAEASTLDGSEAGE